MHRRKHSAEDLGGVTDEINDGGDTRRKRAPTRSTSGNGMQRKSPTRTKSISDDPDSPSKAKAARPKSEDRERRPPGRSKSDRRTRSDARTSTCYKGRRAKLHSSAQNLNFDHLVPDVDDYADDPDDNEDFGDEIDQGGGEAEAKIVEPEATKKSKKGTISKLVKSTISTIDPRKKKAASDNPLTDDESGENTNVTACAG